MIVSLFIYVFYRTDKTLVNQVIIQLVSFKTYQHLKLIITASLPLNKYIIYSLPEGLWVFCITLTSKEFYFDLFKKRINCVFIPLVFVVALELFQLFRITNGYFDFFDIGISLLFWLIAAKIIDTQQRLENLFHSLNYNNLFCVLSYCIVYFAHVIH
ncbi:hypothetical protein CA265_24950 [Sphingobacteriaceae bacterium GW460-11-11-14-LB5]|nr:hypothetical protein CA265_24950 [Sphingobacteriaceae bacterium GW460-11-11-14-LB5]